MRQEEKGRGLKPVGRMIPDFLMLFALFLPVIASLSGLTPQAAPSLIMIGAAIYLRVR